MSIAPGIFVSFFPNHLRASVIPRMPENRRKKENHMSELSIDELESEHAELLPERETMFLNTYISVHQNAFAVAGFGRTNVAIASNAIVVL
jgi:hypothetical protein